MRRSFGTLPDDGRWSVVYVASNPFEAEIVRGLLQEEEIPTLNEPDIGSVFFGKSSGLRILVSREDEASARELLRAYQDRQHLKVINLADYVAERQHASNWRQGVDRIVRLLAIPIFLLVALSLVLVVFRWV
jgi:putative signal transducing protein